MRSLVGEFSPNLEKVVAGQRARDRKVNLSERIYSAMSTTVETMSAPNLIRQSSKKRKIEGDIPSSSKKKIKHTAPSEDPVPSSSVASESTSTKEKQKRKRKSKKPESEAEILVPQSQKQEPEDIEIPDAPTIDVTVAESVQNEDEIQLQTIEEVDDTLMKSREPSCFCSKRISLYVPIPAISQLTSTSSLLSLHLAPLLLTYFPPAEGIVLSFSDPVISAKSEAGLNLPLRAPRSGEIPRNPPSETFARCSDGFGVCWVWLTATFLIFRPQSGDQLKGWTNVQSEGFVGLVSYNYFQTAVGKERIPKEWVWDGPTREDVKRRRVPRKGKLRDEDGKTSSQDDVGSSQVNGVGDEDVVDGNSGDFVDADGNKIKNVQTFKVVDVEVVPGHERDRWTLQIDGSLLSPEQEEAAAEEDKRRFEAQNRSYSRAGTPGFADGEMPLMSGGLGLI